MTDSLMKSADLQGRPLVGLHHAKLGVVREVFVDWATGAVDFIIVEAVGLLGGSGKFHPVPWRAVQYDPAKGVFRIDMAKDDFKIAPSYDREQLANPSYGWGDIASRHFAPATVDP